MAWLNSLLLDKQIGVKHLFKNFLARHSAEIPGDQVPSRFKINPAFNKMTNLSILLELQLVIAVKRCDADQVARLLAQGAQADYQKSLPLAWAHVIMNKSYSNAVNRRMRLRQIIRLLVDAGASIDDATNPRDDIAGCR